MKESNRLKRRKDGAAELAAEITKTTTEFTRLKRLQDDIVTSIETAVKTDLNKPITDATNNKDKKKAIDTLKAAVNKINTALAAVKPSRFLFSFSK